MSELPRPDYGLLDRAGVGGAIFYPAPDHSAPPAGARDLLLEVEPGVSLGARLYTADPALPTILYWHGNGEVVMHHDGIAPMYHEAGANLFVVDFRGYGKSGGHPTFEALVDDGPRAARLFHQHLDELGYASDRYIMGRSLGSHPALEIAARMPEGFRGLIIESGAANIRRMAGRFGGVYDEAEANRLMEAHEAKIRGIRLPVLIIHGEWDELIPLEHAAGLYEMLDGTEREMVVIPRAGHNDILWTGRDQYFEAIGKFVRAGRIEESKIDESPN